MMGLSRNPSENIMDFMRIMSIVLERMKEVICGLVCAAKVWLNIRSHLNKNISK
jgi:hypothetical protein